MTLAELQKRIADVIAENPARANLPVAIRTGETRPDKRKTSGKMRRDTFNRLQYVAQCPITFGNGTGETFAELNAGDVIHVGAWR